MKNDILTKDDLSELAVGSVLVDYFDTIKKKNKSYAIVTEDGLKHFQYDWFLKKYARDPAEHGIGVNFNVLDSSKFKLVEVIKLKPIEKKLIVPALDDDKLYAVAWEESEAGWGVRPDGWSFHISEKEAKAYIVDYWARQPKETPAEYSRPCSRGEHPGIVTKVSASLKTYVMNYGSVWLMPNSISAYETYDAIEMIREKELKTKKKVKY